MRPKAGSIAALNQPSRNVVAKAAAWVSRLSDGDDLTRAESDQLQRWLDADPRHVTELQAQTAIRAVAQDAPGDVRARWLASVEAYERRRFRWRSPWAWAAAGVVMVLVAIITITSFAAWDDSASSNIYVTRTAETRSIRFTDGSIAVLNTRTRLQWVPSGRERRVVLLEGEAFFQVAHDALRPFRMVVDQTTIEDIGTQFDVFRRPNGRVRLTVLEGAVKVALRQSDGPQPAWQRLVRAHQQIDYRGTQIVGDIRRATDEDLEWRKGTVRFKGEPLSQVVEELQRYTDRRIVIADPELARVAVGGIYSTRNIGADLQSIALSAPMVVRERAVGTITLERREAETHHAQ